jgi:ligand-binding sensor domain-containing protein/serine phosphatase RsbU (regulator of sigma subunit)
MKLEHFIFCVTLVLLTSCNWQDNKQKSKVGPNVIEAKGYTVPKDSVTEPEAITAGIPIKVKAGVPKVTPTNLNVRIAGTPKIIAAGLPKINIPGTDTFLLPKTVITKGISKPAGIPEVVKAKDAATKDVNPSNFSFYKTLQGLKHNTVRCMLEDKSGNLWFGTQGGGVCRYDGKSFTNYTEKEGLSKNIVFSILEDKNGNLWFGTQGGGVCRYDGKFFTSFTEKEGLSNNVVVSILEDRNGNLWFGTYGGGVCRYDGQSFTNYSVKEGLSNNGVLSIVEDKTGNLWFGTDGGGVSCFNGKSFINFSENEGLLNNVVFSIYEDKSGNLWFGTDGGVCCYDGNYIDDIINRTKFYQHTQQELKKEKKELVKSFTNYTEKEGLPINVVVTVLGDKNGNLWFGTQGGGICRYDGISFTNFTEKEGLSNNIIYNILQDKSGNLWFGTNGGGVCRYDGNLFTNYSEKEGLSSNIVNAILEDKTGNLWFGTNGGGVCQYDGKTFSNFTEKEGLASNIVVSILEDKSGNIWFGTNGAGVCRYDGKYFTNFTEKEGLSNNIVNAIIEDKKGNLWFGTQGGGVCRFDGNSFTNFTENEGLTNNVVVSILEDKTGNLWFGTNGGGVSRFDGKSFTNFTEKNGLPSNLVLSILEDNSGNLWFGTNSGGLCRYDGRHSVSGAVEERIGSFTTFTEKEGLSNNSVLNMLQDTEGNLWFGTRKGLSKVERGNQKKLAEKLAQSGVEGNVSYIFINEALFYNYGYNDGFLGLNCRRNSVLQDSKGRIWWGTDVLTCFDPKGNIVDKSPPIVNLTSVKLFGEEIAWANLNAVYIDSAGNEVIKGTIRDTLLSNGILLKNIKFDGLTKWYNLPEHLSLPFNNNHITFNFVGVHMQSRNHLKYQYKLEGMDIGWSSITDKTEAPYGNLPSGTYIFKVKAMNQSGVWSEPFQYKFIVRPPWWKTWWAYLFYIGFSGLSIYLIFRWRTSILRKDKELLEVTVKSRTSELQMEKKTVELKNREILSSIEYAKKIQATILPPPRVVKKYFQESFILYLPKDIVAGDFYWMENPISSDTVYFAACDCTGHGVPGAMVSVMCHNALNKSLLEFGKRKPSEILDKVAELVIENFKKNSEDTTQINDGMDASLCALDVNTGELQWAGANNPLWIIKNDNILLETKADKQPVGFSENRYPYTNHTFKMEKGDVIYLITDGLADQFGGPNNRKFQKSRLKNLLMEINKMPMEQQRVLLYDSFANWKGNVDQVDDITIIGVRL